MDYNYHTHTKYCGHAIDEMEEYIQEMIANGVLYMGFSEHAPFRFPDGYESFFRLPMANVNDYLKEAKRLQKVYEKQIDIKIGYEMEYYPLYFKDMLKNVLNYGAEYLILGQHCPGNEHPDCHFSSYGHTSDEALTAYTDCVLSAIQSGVFTYVAHPDVLKYCGENLSLYEQEMKKICLASKEHNIPLEINFCGIRDKIHYPSDTFFSIAGQIGSPITFGMDAHAISECYDKESLAIGKEMVKRHNLNYIGKPNLILLQKKKEEILKKFHIE